MGWLITGVVDGWLLNDGTFRIHTPVDGKLGCDSAICP